MKKIVTMMAVAMSLAAMAAPEYVTKSASGTTAATVYFTADAVKTPRLAGVVATSDKAGAVLSCRAGAGAYVVTVAVSTTTAVNQWINATNGLEANDVLVLQKLNGNCYSSTVASAETNMVTLASGGFGIATAVGDSIYKMSAATSLPVGAATVSYQGEAIYAGNRGRPIRITLDGTSACSIASATAAYE